MGREVKVLCGSTGANVNIHGGSGGLGAFAVTAGGPWKQTSQQPNPDVPGKVSPTGLSEKGDKTLYLCQALFPATRSGCRNGRDSPRTTCRGGCLWPVQLPALQAAPGPQAPRPGPGWSPPNCEGEHGIPSGTGTTAPAPGRVLLWLRCPCP